MSANKMCDFVVEGTIEQRARQNIDTMRLTYGAGIITNFLGARMELNYCIPVKFQPQDQVSSLTC